jgi:hypothetical protein
MALHHNSINLIKQVFLFLRCSVVLFSEAQLQHSWKCPCMLSPVTVTLSFRAFICTLGAEELAALGHLILQSHLPLMSPTGPFPNVCQPLSFFQAPHSYYLALLSSKQKRKGYCLLRCHKTCRPSPSLLHHPICVHPARSGGPVKSSQWRQLLGMVAEEKWMSSHQGLPPGL